MEAALEWEPMPALATGEQQMGDVPTVADLTFDDSLDDMARISRYAASTIALQRLVHVKMMSDSCRLAGFRRTAEVVFPLLEALVTDEEFMVRQHLAEQLRGLAQGVLRSSGEEGYDALLNVVIPAIARLVADPRPDVRISAGEALVAVAALVRKEDLGPRILTIVLQLAHEDEQEELRMTAAVLLNELAVPLGPELCIQFVAPEVICLTEDPVFKVRKAAALNLDAIARTLGPSVSAKRLLPKFLALARDDIWGVRKACAEALVSLSKCLEPSVRVGELIPLFERFVADPSKWVRNAAASHLGPFLATIPGAKVPASLLSHYTRMAGILPPEPSPQQQQQLAAAVAADATGSSDLAAYCSFSFPAVAFTLGRARWGELRAAFHALARDEQPRVRRPLAHALLDLSRIIGPDAAEADLLPVFELYLQDLDEVRAGALKCMGPFLAALAPHVREACLPMLTDALATTAPLNWRARHTLASQLPSLAVTFSPAATFSVIAPWALVLLGDPVAAVREETARGFGQLVARLCSAVDGALAEEVVGRLIALAESRCYRDRILFVRLCAHFVGESEFPPAPQQQQRHIYGRDASVGAGNAAGAAGATAAPSSAADDEGVSSSAIAAVGTSSMGGATATSISSSSGSGSASFPPLVVLNQGTFVTHFLPPLVALSNDPVRNVRVAVAQLLGPLSNAAAAIAVDAARRADAADAGGGMLGSPSESELPSRTATAAARSYAADDTASAIASAAAAAAAVNSYAAEKADGTSSVSASECAGDASTVTRTKLKLEGAEGVATTAADTPSDIIALAFPSSAALASPPSTALAPHAIATLVSPSSGASLASPSSTIERTDGTEIAGGGIASVFAANTRSFAPPQLHPDTAPIEAQLLQLVASEEACHPPAALILPPSATSATAAADDINSSAAVSADTALAESAAAAAAPAQEASSLDDDLVVVQSLSAGSGVEPVSDVSALDTHAAAGAEAAAVVLPAASTTPSQTQAEAAASVETAAAAAADVPTASADVPTAAMPHDAHYHHRHSISNGFDTSLAPAISMSEFLGELQLEADAAADGITGGAAGVSARDSALKTTTISTAPAPASAAALNDSDELARSRAAIIAGVSTVAGADDDANSVVVGHLDVSHQQRDAAPVTAAASASAGDAAIDLRKDPRASFSRISSSSGGGGSSIGLPSVLPLTSTSITAPPVLPPIPSWACSTMSALMPHIDSVEVLGVDDSRADVLVEHSTLPDESMRVEAAATAADDDTAAAVNSANAAIARASGVDIATADGPSVTEASDGPSVTEASDLPSVTEASQQQQQLSTTDLSHAVEVEATAATAFFNSNHGTSDDVAGSLAAAESRAAVPHNTVIATVSPFVRSALAATLEDGIVAALASLACDPDVEVTRWLSPVWVDIMHRSMAGAAAAAAAGAVAAAPASDVALLYHHHRHPAAAGEGATLPLAASSSSPRASVKNALYGSGVYSAVAYVPLSFPRPSITSLPPRASGGKGLSPSGVYAVSGGEDLTDTLQQLQLESPRSLPRSPRSNTADGLSSADDRFAAAGAAADRYANGRVDGSSTHTGAASIASQRPRLDDEPVVTRPRSRSVDPMSLPVPLRRPSAPPAVAGIGGAAGAPAAPYAAGVMPAVIPAHPVITKLIFPFRSSAQQQQPTAPAPPLGANGTSTSVLPSAAAAPAALIRTSSTSATAALSNEGALKRDFVSSAAPSKPRIVFPEFDTYDDVVPVDAAAAATAVDVGVLHHHRDAATAPAILHDIESLPVGDLSGSTVAFSSTAGSTEQCSSAGVDECVGVAAAAVDDDTR